MDYAAARANMVGSQLRTNKVTDLGLLEAFETVPRELFVPADRRGVAYVDEDLAIADGRYLMKPMVLARLMQEAAIEAGDIVLDIGCGSGYSSAILAKVAATVVAVESDKRLAEEANQILSDQGNDNVVVVEAALDEGYPKQAPYNVIFIGGSVADVPKAICDQLIDGGRLVAVVRDRPGLGRARLMQRTGDVVSSRVLFDAATPFLPGFTREAGFVF